MLSASSHDHQKKSLQIKQDDKFFSRIMSKETSLANSSSRIYYGRASGSVPFIWESQPGTPKHQFSDTTLPPLTPPPSYQSSDSKSKAIQKTINKPNLLTTIFPRIPARFTTPQKKNHASPSFSSRSCASSSSSSSWSSSYTFPSRSASSKSHRHSRYFSCSSRSRIHYRMDDDEDHHAAGHGSPTSALCFGVKAKSFNLPRSSYPLVNMKNAFLSIVGHGSSQGTD